MLDVCSQSSTDGGPRAAFDEEGDGPLEGGIEGSASSSSSLSEETGEVDESAEEHENTGAASPDGVSLLAEEAVEDDDKEEDTTAEDVSLRHILVDKFNENDNEKNKRIEQ